MSSAAPLAAPAVPATTSSHQDGMIAAQRQHLDTVIGQFRTSSGAGIQRHRAVLDTIRDVLLDAAQHLEAALQQAGHTFDADVVRALQPVLVAHDAPPADANAAVAEIQHALGSQPDRAADMVQVFVDGALLWLQTTCDNALREREADTLTLADRLANNQFDRQLALRKSHSQTADLTASVAPAGPPPVSARPPPPPRVISPDRAAPPDPSMPTHAAAVSPAPLFVTDGAPEPAPADGIGSHVGQRPPPPPRMNSPSRLTAELPPAPVGSMAPAPAASVSAAARSPESPENPAARQEKKTNFAADLNRMLAAPPAPSRRTKPAALSDEEHPDVEEEEDDDDGATATAAGGGFLAPSRGGHERDVSEDDRSRAGDGEDGEALEPEPTIQRVTQDARLVHLDVDPHQMTAHSRAASYHALPETMSRTASNDALAAPAAGSDPPMASSGAVASTLPASIATTGLQPSMPSVTGPSPSQAHGLPESPAHKDKEKKSGIRGMLSHITKSRPKAARRKHTVSGSETASDAATSNETSAHLLPDGSASDGLHAPAAAATQAMAPPTAMPHAVSPAAAANPVTTAPVAAAGGAPRPNPRPRPLGRDGDSDPQQRLSMLSQTGSVTGDPMDATASGAHGTHVEASSAAAAAPPPVRPRPPPPSRVARPTSQISTGSMGGSEAGGVEAVRPRPPTGTAGASRPHTSYEDSEPSRAGLRPGDRLSTLSHGPLGSSAEPSADTEPPHPHGAETSEGGRADVQEPGTNPSHSGSNESLRTPGGKKIPGVFTGGHAGLAAMAAAVTGMRPQHPRHPSTDDGESAGYGHGHGHGHGHSHGHSHDDAVPEADETTEPGAILPPPRRVSQTPEQAITAGGRKMPPGAVPISGGAGDYGHMSHAAASGGLRHTGSGSAAASSTGSGAAGAPAGSPVTGPLSPGAAAAAAAAAPPPTSYVPAPPPLLALKRKENSVSGDDRAIERQAIDWLNAGLQQGAAHWPDARLSEPGATPGASGLYTELGDGLKLIWALEGYTGQSVGRYNKRVMLPAQKVDNLAVALAFLAANGVETAFCTPHDVMEGDRSKILSLFNHILKQFPLRAPA
ncbi:hypothetical protein CXG81DRAFT_26238 [Caulochytrium protostelioides]|uniref:Calponin-homology (CH) domain-containing protein n=1 Tax=Caulochytrium protostelioides TaxID=1555241 RepID=A0A4P9X7A9_9FUNG|nr:hypothetical protein CXG81DRAFT_26238 [Caulochytrium protostelioides]|eukprot:RKP01092.1 hypothetical protein CXG81DRAFT_26238 [Caulochytrium protostelioides]